MRIPFFSRSAPEPTAPLAAGPRPRRRSLMQFMSGMFKASYVNKDDPWGAIPISPDVFITQRQPILVARSREQWSNNDYVRGYIRRCRQNIVGQHGITLHSKASNKAGKADSTARSAIEAAWKNWGKPGSCDVTGKLSWREIQALAVEHAARDGEFIFRKIYGTSAGPFGFALQLLDPQRLNPRYEDYKYNASGGFIRQGIEFNRYGKPVAYHFSSTDEWDDYYYSISGKGFVRVPADEIIHGFVTEMAGQRRGIPWTSTSLFRLHHLSHFEDSAIMNARASASKMGFIQYREGFGPENEDDVDVGATINAEALSFHELPEGAELAKFDPQYPSGEFAIFSKAMLRGASTGLGVAYNSLANDLEGVNFSSIRDGKIDERDNWREQQEWLIEKLCFPVYEEWLKIALLKNLVVNKAGKPLSPTKIEAYRDVHWQGRRWAWIDPKNDATAKVTEIRGGLTSPSQVIREKGDEPERVYKEIAEDMAMMKEAGIPEQFISVLMGILPAPEATPNHADESEAKPPKTPAPSAGNSNKNG